MGVPPKLLILILLPHLLFAQVPDPVPGYEFVKSPSIVQTKNFYLLSLLENKEEARQLLKTDPELRTLEKLKHQHLSEVVKKCNSADCYTRPLKFTEDEINRVSERLSALYSDQNALGKLVQEHLIPSGTYIVYDTLPPRKLLSKAWELEARAINHVLEVYAEGKHPNYPAIDSIAFNVKARSFGTLAYDVTETVRQEGTSSLFFGPSLHYALRWLEVNGRHEAADFEPMQTTVNRAAYEKAEKTTWDQFKYTLILIPGAGPSEPEVALSAVGMLRCRVGALRYFDGLAPFIVVSGGRVHPFKTKYSEAFEMKRYLMQELHVPESAIILEPHARHTTTNLRNCVRLLFRYGMPIEKPCLVSTTRSQSYYITNEAFAERCRKELGYLPYRLGQRLSETEFEFYPVLDALQIDHDEPLDP